MLCKICNSNIPSHLQIDGKKHNLQSRNHCLTCVPFKSGKRLSVGLSRSRIYKTAECQRCHRTRSILAKNLCATCIVSISRQKLKQRAIEYKGGHCQLCGYCRCSEALTFHHRNPDEKDFNISGQYIRWERVKAELDKCDLLCHNCHTETHAASRIDTM